MGNKNSGRRPSPTALKLLRGNPGKRELNQREPQPPSDAVVKPDYLTPISARIWDEMAPDCIAMGTLTRPDIEAFAKMCELEASARFWSQGKELPGWKNQREERDAAAALKAFYIEFGKTPSSRSRIKVPKQPEQKNKLEALLSAG
jgi:phage terminase small subunit